MAGNGAQTLEGTEEKIQNAAPPTEETKPEVAPAAAAPQTTQSNEQSAAEPAAPTSDQDTIRSVFVARTTAASEASVGAFAKMEMTDIGHAMRGAYLARLTVVEAEAVAANPAAEGDVLRKAYLARAVAGAAAQPARQRRTTSPAKRKKASRTKAKRQVAPASAAKTKKRSAKPRAAARRPPRDKRRSR